VILLKLLCAKGPGYKADNQILTPWQRHYISLHYTSTGPEIYAGSDPICTDRDCPRCHAAAAQVD